MTILGGIENSFYPDWKSSLTITKKSSVNTECIKSESHLYIVAARLTEIDEEDGPPINVTFTVEDLGYDIASVYSEDRTISVTNNTFQDSFYPWEVHVYLIPKAYTKLNPPLNLRLISE